MAMVTGDPEKAYWNGVSIGKDLYCTDLPEGMDVVIANSWPKDTEGTQSAMAFVPLSSTRRQVLAENGTRVLVTASPEGLGFHSVMGPGTLFRERGRSGVGGRAPKASVHKNIVFSPNMSVAVNVFFSLIEKAAKILGKDYNVSIKEAHHIHKKDKPSGTAKLMANIVKEKLRKADIPIESIREGEIVGKHDITFEGKVDTLKISHSARTRDIFALGALRAARFVAKKDKGLFSMADVLEEQ